MKSVLRAATDMYFLYEQYHHKIECLASRTEVASGRPAYVKYHAGVYSAVLGTDRVLEEALANAGSFQRIGESR
jgi:hypothetical protein